MASFTKTEAIEKIVAVGVSEGKAEKLLEGFTKNAEGNYDAKDVEEFKEQVASKNAELTAIIQKYETKGNGFITKEDAIKVGKEEFPNVPEESITMMVTSYDRDNNDKVDIKELTEFFISLFIKKKSLIEHFKGIDGEKKGDLEYYELVDILLDALCLNEGFEVYWIIETFDKNKDNKISQEEFITMWIDLFG